VGWEVPVRRLSAEYCQVKADRWDTYEYRPTLDEHWQRAPEAQHVWHRRTGGVCDDLLTDVKNVSTPGWGIGKW